MPHYNMMGVAKAALEASVRFLAYDLGPQGVRVNAISAGPLRTIAARSISGFSEMYSRGGALSMLKRNITQEEVAGLALTLVADELGSGITGGDDLCGRGFSRNGDVFRGVGSLCFMGVGMKLEEKKLNAVTLSPALRRMTYEAFLESDEDTWAEWVDGEVVYMSPPSSRHQDVSDFLTAILRHFVEIHDVGVTRSAPFQMKTGPDLAGTRAGHPLCCQGASRAPQRKSLRRPPPIWP